MFDQSDPSCVMCGGDGRIANAFGGATKTCPSCHGSGRRMEDFGPRDVTKTKSAQGRQPAGSAKEQEQGVVRKGTGPWTSEGLKLAGEVKVCAILSPETKTRLVAEIIAYETSHGSCTRTFSKKIRKQLRSSPTA